MLELSAELGDCPLLETNGIWFLSASSCNWSTLVDGMGGKAKRFVVVFGPPGISRRWPFRKSLSGAADLVF